MNVPGKVDLTPRRYHGYAIVLTILGTLFPPLAVAARFGVGKDFFINLVLTICGYIPGHLHNFYIQNIRNNKTHARTPKWAQRYGLVNTAKIKRNERKSQWAVRYRDRLPQSTLEGQAYAEGQEADGSSMSLEDRTPRANGSNGEDYWRAEDEQYYTANNRSTTSTGRWRYPANFDDTIASPPSSSQRHKSKSKNKKDRFARTEDAYSLSEEADRRRKHKRKKNKSSRASTYSRTTDGSAEFPESAEGGLYGERQVPEANGQKAQTTDDDLQHEF
ncbi:hypothetical protein FISHEDRAFT_64452 [Fistulina hepatica ATCC 64428]|nr:hypothetical protein FISHEDRAFT_64452 [Fistulina hepatica ATCC 64428]